MRQKAKTLSEIIDVFTPAPLNDDNWNFWQNTDEVRETVVIPTIIEKLKESMSKNPIKILFCGHRGCGKSTELNRIFRKMKDQFEIVSESIERYPLHAIDHRLVLYFCAEILLETAERMQIHLQDKEKDTILGWFDEKSIQDIKEQGYNVDVHSGAGIKILNLIKAGFSGKISRASQTREESLKFVLDRMDRYLNGLSIISEKIIQKTQKPLLLIIENLDKVNNLDQARGIFLDNPKIFKNLPFHAIFTFPIGLWLDPKTNLTADYDNPEILPMIPVNPPPSIIEQGEEKARKGRDCLKSLFYKRVEESADLIDSNSLHLLIINSGGVLRDFSYLIRESCIRAQVEKSEKIQKDHVERTLNKLQQQYETFLGEFENFKVPDILNLIDQFKNGPLVGVDHTEIFKHLLQNLCILEYNGERWHDLHPLIRNYMERKKWIEKK